MKDGGLGGGAEYVLLAAPINLKPFPPPEWGGRGRAPSSFLSCPPPVIFCLWIGPEPRGLRESTSCPRCLTRAAKEQEGEPLEEAQPAMRRAGRRTIFIGLAFLLTELFPNDIYLTVLDSSYEHVSGTQNLYSLRLQLPVSS